MSNKFAEYKAIADYTGLSFIEVQELTYYEYCVYRKEAWIYNLNQSEEGKEFLKDIWRLNQTNADLAAVRQFNNRK